MDLFLIVSTPGSGEIVRGLGSAANRRGADWGAFFTSDGVKVLGDAALADILSGAKTAVACQESWQHHMDAETCPIELGSQTSNSLAVAGAARIISL